MKGGLPMMKNGWMSFVATFTLLFAFSAYGDEWGEITIPPEKPIKIGLGAMLTGDYASLGIDIKYGAEMAVQEKGKIQGHPIHLQSITFPLDHFTVPQPPVNGQPIHA